MSNINENKVKKIPLTSRQKNIIDIIVKNSTGNPIKIATISDKLNLSTRTVLREMPIIEEWLLYNKFDFKRKSGVGLLLDETYENHEKILMLLQEEASIYNYSKEERRQYILSELLNAKDPLKSSYFAKKYQVSTGVIYNDLDKIYKWCEKFNIRLNKKQGFGVYLESNEKNLRQAIGSFIYELYNDNEIYAVLKNKTEYLEKDAQIKKNSKDEIFFNLIKYKNLNVVEKIIYELQDKMKIQYLDRSYIDLVIHISIAITRNENGNVIKIEKSDLKQLEKNSVYEIAEIIADKLGESFEIVIPSEEIAYIEKRLSGVIFLQNDEGLPTIDKENVKDEILDLIYLVEKKLVVKFYDYETLSVDLINHIMPMINRLQLNIITKNSFLENIQDEYMDIFTAVKESAVELKTFLSYGFDKIPDEEICFMTMYFCVAVENNKKINEQIRVVVSCPTGMSTSKILAMSVSKNFPNIEVVNVISMHDVSTDYLNDNSIDIVISTVDIDVNVSHIENVVTSPILKVRDIQLINLAIEKVRLKNTEG